MQTNIQSPQSICLLRLSAIGDVCHAVATVQALQKRWPQAEITWVIGKVEFQLLKGLKGVKFVIFDKQAGFAAYRLLRKELKSYHFDILLHMQVALRASLATLCIKAREVWGFDKQRAKEAQWLFTNRRIQPQTEPHVAEGFLGFAKALGVAKSAMPEWRMPLEQKQLDWQQEQLEKYGRYVVISPAASKPERNWLAERYAAFANYANEQGFSVVLCGGPGREEAVLAEKIVTNCDFSPINLVGKTNLKQLLAVLKKAEVVLAPDTGPAHMAVTVGTPVIGLYAHSNPKRTGPYCYQNYVVSCYEEVFQQQYPEMDSKSCWGKRVKGNNLMTLIEVDRVLATFDQVISDLNG